MSDRSSVRAQRRGSAIVLRLLGSLAILAALALWLPLDELEEAISSVPGWLWFGCLLGFVAGHVAGAFKWHLLLNLRNRGPSFAETLRFYFAGLFANLFLPSVAGGDIVRAGLAMRSGKSRSGQSRSGESKEVVVFASFVDRLIDTATLVTFVVLGAVVSRHILSGRDAVIVGVVAVLLVGVVAAVAVAAIVPLPDWLPEHAAKIQKEVRAAASALAGDRRRALAAWIISMAVQGSFVGLTVLLGRACGIEISVGAWLFSWPLAKLAAMVPVSLAGIGVREAALAGLLGRFGVPGATAVALGLVWETILVTGSATGGIFYALARRRGRNGQALTS